MASLSRDEIPWRTQAAIYGAGLVGFSMVVISSLVIAFVIAERTQSAFLIGLVLGSRYFLTVILSIHGGVMMDRLGTRRVMIVFGIVATIVPLLFPLALSLPLGRAVVALVVLQMVAGLSDAMGWMGSQTLSGNILQGRRLYIGRMTAIVRVGAFVGPVLFGFLWETGGLWPTFIVMSLWSGLGLLSAWKIPSLAEDTAELQHTRVRPRDLMPRFSDYISAFSLALVPAIGLVLLVTVVRIAGTGIQSSFYVVFLKDFGISAAMIGILIGVAQLVASGGSLSARPLARVIHPHWLIIVAVAITVVTIAVTPFLTISAPFFVVYGLLMLVIGLRGLCLGISQPLEISILGRALGASSQGKGVGLRTTVNRIASAVIPPFMGGVAEFVGIANSFLVMGGILSLVLAVAAIAVFRRRDLAD